MKLSKVAILALRGMDRVARKSLADQMGVTEDTLYRWMRTNDEKFTLAAHLMVLRRELGLTDNDLLEEDRMSKIA
jgi:DNA-binding transcriptional regulator YiaG